MEKLYNDKRQVAVLVSHGYGAGWSTWEDVNPMDKRYAELILNGKLDEAEELAEAERYYPDGLSGCKVHWLDEGTKFFINEYDGAEELITSDERIYIA